MYVSVYVSFQWLEEEEKGRKIERKRTEIHFIIFRFIFSLSLALLNIKTLLNQIRSCLKGNFSFSKCMNNIDEKKAQIR